MRRLTILATIALLAALGATPAGAAQRAIVRRVADEAYPRVTLEVMLPAADSEQQTRFTVTENGEPVELAGVVRSRVERSDVVLLIDTSGSMKGGSLRSGASAARQLVSELPDGSKVAVVSFSDKAQVAVPFTSDRSRATAVLGGLDPAGETALYDALAQAVRAAKSAKSARPVAVLLSDGGDTVSRTSLDSAVKSLRAAGIPVIVVALPSAEADFGALRSIADKTGGRFVPIRSAGDLDESYKRLARELTTGWAVTYVSRRPSTAQLDIEVNAQRGERRASGSVTVRNPSFRPGEGAASLILDIAPADTATFSLVLVLAFLSVSGLAFSIGIFLKTPKTGLEDLRFYDQLHEADQPTAWSEDAITASVYRAVDRIVGSRGFRREIHRFLERAGLPLRPTEYVTMHLLLVIAAGSVAQFASQSLVVGVTAVALATVTPMVWVRLRIGRRRRRFDEQLPDTLTLLAGSLRAGWGLQHSFGLVIEQMADPIASEFARANNEVRLGRPLDEALFAIADRLQSDDFRWTATAIAIQREVGGNLAEVLDTVAHTMRDRSALKRQIAGLVAEGRLSAVILIILPFVLALLITTLNPEYMLEMVTTPAGLVMLGLGCTLLAFGSYWLSRAIAIEV